MLVPIASASSEGAQWLSGRVLDSRPKGRGFEPLRRHCVVSLSKNINPSLLLVQPKKIPPFIIERVLMGRKESNQTNKSASSEGSDETARMRSLVIAFTSCIHKAWNYRNIKIKK